MEFKFFFFFHKIHKIEIFRILTFDGLFYYEKIFYWKFFYIFFSFFIRSYKIRYAFCLNLPSNCFCNQSIGLLHYYATFLLMFLTFFKFNNLSENIVQIGEQKEKNSVSIRRAITSKLFPCFPLTIRIFPFIYVFS